MNSNINYSAAKDNAIENAHKMLDNIGDGIEIIFSGYSDANGTSIYFKAIKGDKEVKIRISDHSVLNSYRIQNEVCINLYNKYITDSINEIKYALGIEGYKYGKTTVTLRSGEQVEAFGFYKLD